MRQVLSLLIVLCPLAFSIFACKEIPKGTDYQEKNEWKECWVIGSRHAQTPDFPVVWWVRRNNSSEWTLLYPPSVNGLKREEGYEYEIVVIAHAEDMSTLPEDTPSISYTLFEIISVQEKESEGIPFFSLDPS